MGGSSDEIIGHRYYFGIHMGVSRGPVDELVEVTVGDKVVWQGSVTDNGSVTIDKPELFGGDKKEGGVAGKLDIMMGGPTQSAPSGLASMLSGAVPGFRKTFSLFFDGLVCSNSPYPKKWVTRQRRVTSNWDGPVFMPDIAAIWMTPSVSGTEHVESIKAMNPAHIIFETLTNREWGRGLPREALDIPSFEAAASTLYGEGFGMCIRWTRTDEIQAFIQNILDHISGTLFLSRQTALLTLRLIRGGYDSSTLPLYDTSNGVLDIREASVASPAMTTNEMIVTYREAVTNQDRQVRVTNLASLQSSGGAFNSLTREYRGLPTSDLARRVAQRDLRVTADGLRRFSITMDRRAWDFEPGGLFRIKDEARGIPETVVRIGKIEDGTLKDGKITLSVMQDAFDMPAASYIEEQPSLWVPPVTESCMGRFQAFELPYFMLARRMDAADFAMLTDTSAGLGVVVELGRSSNVEYDIAVRAGAPTEDDWPEDESKYCGYKGPSSPYRFAVIDTSGGDSPDLIRYVIDNESIRAADLPITTDSPLNQIAMVGDLAIAAWRVDSSGDPVPPEDQPTWTFTGGPIMATIPIDSGYAAMLGIPEGSCVGVYYADGTESPTLTTIESSDGFVGSTSLIYPGLAEVSYRIDDAFEYDDYGNDSSFQVGRVVGGEFSVGVTGPVGSDEHFVMRATTPRRPLFYNEYVSGTLRFVLSATGSNSEMFEYGFVDSESKWADNGESGHDLTFHFMTTVNDICEDTSIRDKTKVTNSRPGNRVRFRGDTSDGTLSASATPYLEYTYSAWNMILDEIRVVPEEDLADYGFIPYVYPVESRTYTDYTLDYDYDLFEWNVTITRPTEGDFSHFDTAATYSSRADFYSNVYATRKVYQGTWNYLAETDDYTQAPAYVPVWGSATATGSAVSSTAQSPAYTHGSAGPDPSVAGVLIAKVTNNISITYTATTPKVNYAPVVDSYESLYGAIGLDHAMLRDVLQPGSGTIIRSDVRGLVIAKPRNNASEPSGA